jgi:hypothetical protein
MCAGHFDTNPCFPVAFMCSHLFNIGAESVAELSGVSLSYTKRNNKSLNSDNERSNNQRIGSRRTNTCYGWYICYGLDVDCTTKYNPNHKDGPVYETVRERLIQIVLKSMTYLQWK